MSDLPVSTDVSAGKRRDEIIASLALPIPIWPAPAVLRKDFIYKVRHSEMRDMLQDQLRDASPIPPVCNHELFDPSRPWQEHRHPRVAMCDIRLTDIVSEFGMLTGLEVNPNRSPNCIEIQQATNPDYDASSATRLRSCAQETGRPERPCRLCRTTERTVRAVHPMPGS